MKKIFSVLLPCWVTGILLGLLFAMWRVVAPEDGLLILARNFREWIMNGKTLPEFNIMTAFWVAAFAGGCVAAFAGDKFRLLLLEEGGSFTDRVGRSLLWAGGGGFLLMLGCIISGDLPWDHFSRALQMSRPSWLFIAGMVMAGCFLAIMLGSVIVAAGDDGSVRQGGKDKAGKKK